MLTLAAIALISVLAAPGEIYRCKDAAGAMSYQDHPCAANSSGAKIASKGDTAASQLELQQWLDGYRKRTLVSTPQASGASVRRVPGPQSAGIVTEAQLAMCSERFLHCAHGDDATMDRCVARLPRCGSGGAGSCCPQACVSRYQNLREAGQPLASAVRLALIDPDAPACGAAGSR